MYGFQHKPLSGTKTTVPISLKVMEGEQTTILCFEMNVTIYLQSYQRENRLFSTKTPSYPVLCHFQ